MAKDTHTVVVVRCRTDNLCYLVPGSEGNCLVIDPGDADPVLRELAARGWRPERILATHGHADHTAGAERITRETGCAGLDRIGHARDIRWSGGRLESLPVPGHTRDGMAYVDADRRALFTGDTLFIAGCGRLLGASAADMWASLLRLRALPGDLRVYPGHDYTCENLAFAAHLDPDDTAVAARLERARSGDPLVPSLLEEERRTNPFLRGDDSAFRTRVGLSALAAEACFAELRRRKDVW